MDGIGRSYFDISYEIGLVQPQQYFFAKHQIKSFMLYMGISQNVFIVSVQNPPQNLPVYFIFLIDHRVVLVDPEELDHVKAGFRLVERDGKNLQPFIVMLGGENGEVSIKYLNDKFGNVCGLSFLFLRLLDEQWEDSIKRFDELSWIEQHLLVSFCCGRCCLWLVGRHGLSELKSTSVI